MRVLAAVLGALMVTAGCISGGASTAPAMSDLDTAREAAKTWVDDPQLVGLYGIEPPHRIVQDGTEVVIHADPEPGDGNAPGWGYIFTGEGGAVGILMIAGLGVLAEAYTEDPGELDVGAPITDWELDSTRVASILAEREEWPARAEDHTVFWGLAMEDGRPVWHVGIEDVDGTDTVYGDVDASDGSVLRIERNERGFLEPEFGAGGAAVPGDSGCEMAHAEGRITPVESVGAEVDLPTVGSLFVSLDHTGVGLLRLTTAYEGEPIFQESITAVGPLESPFRVTYEDLPPGSYAVTAEAEGAALAEVVLNVAASWGSGPGACFAEDETSSRAPAAGLLKVLTSSW